MRDKESDRGGVDGAMERSLNSDGGNEPRTKLGRDYETMGRGHKKMHGRGKKSKRGMMGRRGH